MLCKKHLYGCFEWVGWPITLTTWMVVSRNIGKGCCEETGWFWYSLGWSYQITDEIQLCNCSTVLLCGTVHMAKAFWVDVVKCEGVDPSHVCICCESTEPKTATEKEKKCKNQGRSTGSCFMNLGRKWSSSRDLRERNYIYISYRGGWKWNWRMEN